jgi:hypothetical protein
MKYFALGSDGCMYDLCDCGDFDAAEESAHDLLHPMMVDAVWIASEDVALAWCDRVLNSFFGITTADIADWDLEADGLD